MSDKKPSFGGGRTEAVRRDFEQNPESLRFVPLARTYLDRGDAEEAERVARKALESRPNNALALGLLGRALTGLGRFDEAEDTLARALSFERGEAELWRFMGQLRVCQGRLGEGVAYLEAAANLAPADDELAAELGRVQAAALESETARRQGFAEGRTEVDPGKQGPLDVGDDDEPTGFGKPFSSQTTAKSRKR